MGGTLPNTVDTSRTVTSAAMVEIDGEEFEVAERDPEVHDLLNKAASYGAALEHEGRDR